MALFNLEFLLSIQVCFNKSQPVDVLFHKVFFFLSASNHFGGLWNRSSTVPE